MRLAYYQLLDTLSLLIGRNQQRVVSAGYPVNTQGEKGGLRSEQETNGPIETNLQPQRRYSVQDLARTFSLSTDLIRRLFIDEPGVHVIQKPRKGYRTYRTLRVPGWVAIAVFKRLTNGEKP